MTEAEINLAIARLEHPDAEITQDNYNWGSCALIRNEQQAFDYVGNWADIGPIIERERIGVALVHGDVYRAYSNEVFAIDRSPTKAAALCYLKIKGLISG